MRNDKPSKTARKVALNIVTLGAKQGMDKVLPPGIVETTAKLLLASGAVGATAIRLSHSRRIVSVYEAFDWMMPGLTMWILKVTGEPWLWSIQPEKLGRFLKDRGWTSALKLVGTTGKHGMEFFSIATK